MTKIEINRPKLLIVEGNHEFCFFTRLLETEGITDVQVMAIGGKTLLNSNLKLLVKDPFFDSVISIGVTRDADNNYAQAFEAVQNALNNVGLNTPNEPLLKTQAVPAISIFIFPNNHDQGALENLCLDSVRDYPTIDCVNAYMKCISKIQGEHSHYSKAAVQVFLAKEEEGDVSMSTASMKNVWPLDNDVYSEILGFIRNL